ncbi:hypothetical protein OC842_000053 [Tilletia horrida]|uniref:Uncharacterized protein n=1 Tax=Tilletia horrida TaxID=155126 RepID=A0AAN6GHK7_9BASI|nr:hypothetical protein OC842_000053 [Tilletia horrida]
MDDVSGMITVPRYLIIDILDSSCARGSDVTKYQQTYSTLKAFIDVTAPKAPTTPASCAPNTTAPGSEAGRDAYPWTSQATPSRLPQASSSGPLHAPFILDFNNSFGPTINNVASFTTATQSSFEAHHSDQLSYNMTGAPPICDSWPGNPQLWTSTQTISTSQPQAPQVPQAPQALQFTPPPPAVDDTDTSAAQSIGEAAPASPGSAGDDVDASMDTLVEEAPPSDAADFPSDKLVSKADQNVPSEEGDHDDSAPLTDVAPEQARAFAPLVKALQEQPDGLTINKFVKVVGKSFRESSSNAQTKEDEDWLQQKKAQDKWLEQLGAMGALTIAGYIKATSPWLCLVEDTIRRDNEHIVVIRLKDVKRPYFLTQQPTRVWHSALSKIILEQHQRKRKRR